MNDRKARGSRGAQRRALPESVLELRPRAAPQPLCSSHPGRAARPRTRSPRGSCGAEALSRPGSTPPCPADAARRRRSPRPLKDAAPGTGNRRRWRGRPLPPGGREPPRPGRVRAPRTPPRNPQLRRVTPLPGLVSPVLLLLPGPGPPAGHSCPAWGRPGFSTLRSELPSRLYPSRGHLTSRPHRNPASKLGSVSFSLQNKGAVEELSAGESFLDLSFRKIVLAPGKRRNCRGRTLEARTEALRLPRWSR